MPLEIIGTIYPTCPHCEHDHKETYQDFNLTMEKWGTRECEFCGMEFQIYMETIYSTKIIKSGV